MNFARFCSAVTNVNVLFPIHVMRFTPVLKITLGVLTFAVVGISDSKCEEGNPIPENELPRFLGRVRPDQFTWRVMIGPDFEVYHGTANPPLAGTVGFYFGGAPQKLKASPTIVKSRLGRFPIKWNRSIGTDGSIEQEAIIVIDSAMELKAHVWASAPNESQLNNMLSVVGQLPTFASGAIPERFEEYHDIAVSEQRGRRLIWAGWWALIIAAGWVVDRFCRRRKMSAAARLLGFAGVIALTIGITIAALATSHPDIVIIWFHRANGLLLFWATVALCVVTLALAAALFLVRLFRNRNSRRNFVVG
ncbi:MAG: hypothetical protein ABR611_15005 [Chthoniobacterales bacterium]